ncbi:hypothetical protein RJ640_030919 [Escallonia rubra]|uniref:Uncharacterized protein n=1 Tax=Escallonia rubra TaxID=112253 RepID=A0AA88UC56_9ASTE|nr:hypothetical protein RJ640_030919 [Escallonia rubra]
MVEILVRNALEVDVKVKVVVVVGKRMSVVAVMLVWHADFAEGSGTFAAKIVTANQEIRLTELLIGYALGNSAEMNRRIRKRLQYPDQECRQTDATAAGQKKAKWTAKRTRWERQSPSHPFAGEGKAKRRAAEVKARAMRTEGAKRSCCCGGGGGGAACDWGSEVGLGLGLGFWGDGIDGEGVVGSEEEGRGRDGDGGGSGGGDCGCGCGWWSVDCGLGGVGVEVGGGGGGGGGVCSIGRLDTEKLSGEVYACKSISKKKLRTIVDIEDVRREV